jgi:two-component system cell cycle response regulator CtrA
MSTLRDQNDELREKVRQLEEVIGLSFQAPVEFGLTRREEMVLGTLLRRERLSKEQIMTVMYSDRISVPDIRILDVYVCRLRKKLKPFEIEIRTMWGIGYALPPASKAIIKQFLTPEPVA